MKKSTLKFTKESTVEDIKRALRETDDLLRLEVVECPVFDDALVAEVTSHMNEELWLLSAVGAAFSDVGVAEIVKRCRQLQYVSFVGCRRIGEASIRHIGSYCHGLKSVTFELRDASCWKTPGDALSVLVKNCASELTAVTFIAFDTITDIGVNYMAECYFNSLQKVDFSLCSRLTDVSIVGIATMCKYLRELSVGSSQISDDGLRRFAEKCPKLKKLDITGCVEVTNVGIESLSQRCERLEDVSVAGCLELTDASFKSLVSHCPQLHSLDFSRTSLAKVPVTLLTLRRLRRLKLEGCTRLCEPPQSVVDSGLDGVLEYYRDYNLAYRLKVFVLGDRGSGRSSVVNALTSGPLGAATTTTDQVTVTTWQPLRPRNKRNDTLKLEERQLTFEFWEFSGGQAVARLAASFLTPAAMFVVVVNLLDVKAAASAVRDVNTIQCKAPGSYIIIVATRSDMVSADLVAQRTKVILDHLHATEKEALENIKAEMSSMQDLDADPKVTQRLYELQSILAHRPQLPRKIQLVSCTSQKGLSEMRKEMVSKAMDLDNFIHIGHVLKPGTLHLYERILKARESGLLLLTWEAYNDMALSAEVPPSEGELEVETSFLQIVGAIQDFRFFNVHGDSSSEQTRYISIQPVRLARAVCSLLVEDSKKSFKIEAQRFWPPESDYKKPDPSLLVQALEGIPIQGLILECLLPILWQDMCITEAQILQVLDLLQWLGIIATHPSDCNHNSGLAMPDFLGLSTRKRYAVPLLNLLPTNKPELNWSPKPFLGDIQITWRYRFANAPPDGVSHRVLAVCRKAQGIDSYCHMWCGGILMTMGEATVHVMTEDSHVEVNGRVNADMEGSERVSIDYLWAQMAPLILAVHQFIISWPGLLYTIDISPYGAALFKGTFVRFEHNFPILKCLEYAQKGQKIKFTENSHPKEMDAATIMPFEANEAFHSLEAWLHYILSKRDTVISMLDSGALPRPEKKESLPPEKDPPPVAHTSKRSKMPCEVTWNKEISFAGTTPTASNGGDVTPNRAPAKKKSTPAPKTATIRDSLQEDINQNIQKVSRSVQDASTSPGPGLGHGASGGHPSEGEVPPEARRTASRFVAAILAGAMAEHIRQMYEKGKEDGTYSVTIEQVQAAQLTAEAARAAEFGMVEEAALVVQKAARQVGEAVNTHSATKGQGPGGKGRGSWRRGSRGAQAMAGVGAEGGDSALDGSARSKLCVLL